MTALRALVVDFGGVMTTSVLGSFQAFADELGVDAGVLAPVVLGAYSDRGDDLVTGFETGRIDEHEFARLLAARMSEACGRPVPAAGLVARMLAGLQLEPEMVDLLRAVRGAGFRTALLSNSWGTDGYPRDLLTELFDVVVISGEVGLRKPDPAIFRLTCRRLGVDATECVFVDDHPGHLGPARALGFTTVLHRSPPETAREVETILGIGVTSGED